MMAVFAWRSPATTISLSNNRSVGAIAVFPQKTRHKQRKIVPLNLAQSGSNAIPSRHSGMVTAEDINLVHYALPAPFGVGAQNDSRTTHLSSML